MIVHIALSIPVTKTFSYSVPDRWEPYVERISRVKVPFHDRTTTGFVMDIEEGDNGTLKEIQEVIDIVPLIDEPLLQLAEWAAHHYVTPIGVVLKYVVPASLRIEKWLTIKTLSASLSALDGILLSKAYKMYGRDTLFRYYREGSIELASPFTGTPFAEAVGTERPDTVPAKTLYVGEVGSRIEYYGKAISEHLEQGKNVLMLLPDYRTTGQYFHQMLEKLFGQNILWYGSSVKAGTRMEAYFRARNEGGRLILGNKSGLFLPVRNLTLIIVERQEEDEYRNEKGFKFNAATAAIRRAEIEHVPILFGSASPSLEAFKRAQDGEFTLVRENRPVTIAYRRIDTGRKEASHGMLPDALLTALREAAENGETVGIFTPRRDYGSFIHCLECKKPLLCPLCEGGLSYQKGSTFLRCSKCGEVLPYDETCPHCGSHLLHFLHPGVEYLAEHLRNIIKDVPVVVITGDTPKRQILPLRGRSGRVPAVLIGTQVLSKLYAVAVDRLILIGWEDLLQMGGYRAEEKMFQVIINLTDALKPRELCVLAGRKQSFDPSCVFDFDGFYARELDKRRLAEFPPYTRLFLIEVEKQSRKAGQETIERIHRIIEEEGLLSSMMGTLETKKRSHTWRIALKGDDLLLHKTLLRIYDLPDVRIEADPMSV
jgi:primosomal protein N' (replication factor Y) (superfamily II helicase)